MRCLKLKFKCLTMRDETKLCVYVYYFSTSFALILFSIYKMKSLQKIQKKKQKWKETKNNYCIMATKSLHTMCVKQIVNQQRDIQTNKQTKYAIDA